MGIPKLSKPVTIIVSSITAVLSLIFAIWKFDAHYAKADELSKMKDSIETKTVQTFEVFQMRQETINNGIRLNILNIEYERAMDELSKLKCEFKKDSSDTDLELEIDEVKKRIENINKKRNELRDKLTGVD